MKNGQSMLEYVITLTVIIAAIMAASGNLRGRVQTGMQTAVGSINSLLNANPSIK